MCARVALSMLSRLSRLQCSCSQGARLRHGSGIADEFQVHRDYSPLDSLAAIASSTNLAIIWDRGLPSDSAKLLTFSATGFCKTIENLSPLYFLVAAINLYHGESQGFHQHILSCWRITLVFLMGIPGIPCYYKNATHKNCTQKIDYGRFSCSRFR